MVMCSEPVMRTPASGFFAPYFSRVAIRPGISRLGDGDFLAAQVGEGDVFDFIVAHGGGASYKSTYQDALICL